MRRPGPYEISVVWTAHDLGRARRSAPATVVVIDVLRATSTMVAALAAGARAIVPAVTIAEARRLIRGERRAVLGGERGGLPPRGFLCGNSPAEYGPARVRGAVVVLTTSNGTGALRRATPAPEVLVAALVNRQATADYVARRAGGPLLLVCAGDEGRVALEDVMGAGALIAALAERGPWLLSDSAEVAAAAFDVHRHRPLACLRRSRHGRHLVSLGLEKDLAWCARLDAVPLVAGVREGRVVRLPVGASSRGPG